MNKTKNKEEYYKGVLTAYKPIGIKSAKDHVNIAKNWLKNKEFVPWGHNRKSIKENGYLFVRQKGEKDVIALLEYEDVLARDKVKKNMLPPEYVEEGDYERYRYFYKVIKVIWPKYINDKWSLFIPFNMLEDGEGNSLNPLGGMHELVHVQVKDFY